MIEERVKREKSRRVSRVSTVQSTLLVRIFECLVFSHAWFGSGLARYERSAAGRGGGGGGERGGGGGSDGDNRLNLKGG